MNKIFFIIIYFLVLQNFLLTNVIADSGFSSDFIEQAKKLGINIGQNLDEKVNDNDLPNTSNLEAKPDVKLPEPQKPEAKPEVNPNNLSKQQKIIIKLNKAPGDKNLFNQKQQVIKKSNNIK